MIPSIGTEMENASNISHEEIIYKFDHQGGENADLPMLGTQTKVRDLKPVKAILERTTKFSKVFRGIRTTEAQSGFQEKQAI